MPDSFHENGICFAPFRALKKHTWLVFFARCLMFFRDTKLQYKYLECYRFKEFSESSQ